MNAVLGLALALGAGSCYGFGVTLQALEARRAPARESLHLALLRRLVSRPRWIVGTCCVVAGWALQATALLLAPVTVVQPALAVGLFVLLVAGARLSQERVGRREVIAVVAIIVGVGGLAITAPGQAEGDGNALVVGIGLGLLGIAALVPYSPRRGHWRTGAPLAISAGFAYSWSGFSTKFVADAIPSEAWIVVLVWLGATGVGAGIGLLSEMTALQQRSAIHVFPIMLVVQIVTVVLLAPLVAGEGWTGGALSLITLSLSLAVVAVGAGLLATAPAVRAAVSTDHGYSSSRLSTFPVELRGSSPRKTTSRGTL